MKKLPGLLLLILIALQPGCKKSNDVLGVVNAHVLYGGDPVVDGPGYYIHLDGSGENIVALNLPSSYQHPTVNEAVAIKFVDTGKRRIVGFADADHGGWRVVYIVTIRNL
ncbi:MAG TPA: hypothetical protein VKQ52_04320 [Puia sp.]|nr:hypothetical protein [Puia sp.]